MVSLDQLAALDLLLWLTGSERAAKLEDTNQSTIVRRSQAAEACFEVAIQRDPSGWRLEGDSQLLQLERQLHQLARLLGHRPLRLHAPFWTRKTQLRQLPQGWCCNPATATSVCENPVELLRARVIDAALLTPTQLPATLRVLASPPNVWPVLLSLAPHLFLLNRLLAARLSWGATTLALLPTWICPSLARVLSVPAPPPAIPNESPTAMAMPSARLSIWPLPSASRLLWSAVACRLIASLARRSAPSPTALRTVW